MSFVNSVTVSPRSIRLQVGEWYYGAWAEISPADDCVWIEWYSENPEIAGVNRSSGYIYAHRVGTVKIYAKAVDYSGAIVATDYITVTVSSVVPVRSVTLDRVSIPLEEGDSFTLTAMICPENATNQELNWRSTKPEVATVCYGEVIARKAGHACIIAEAADGSGAFAECDVYVTAATLTTSVRVYPTVKEMRVGESTFLHAEVCPEYADDKTLTWISVDPSVATVSPNSGLIFAQGVGRTTIKAVPQDGGADPGECVLIVLPPIHVTDITLETTSLTMIVNDTKTLDATVCPSNATNTRVEWLSSNEDVASVDYYTGEITARSVGEATITARTADGGLSASCAVIVTYCGGSDYRDVTKHRLVLQNDGYYVCTTCGYRIKSPELEDKDILSSEDYLKIVSVMHFYTQCKLLAEKNELTKEYNNLQAEFAQLYIDSLRSQEKYSAKYSYVNSQGLYHCDETNENTLSFVDIADIHILNIGVYNGVYESVCAAVFAYYCPQIALLADVLGMVTGQMNALDFGAFVADMYEDAFEEMAKYSNALTIASTLLDMVTSEVSLDDRVVRVNLDHRTSAHYIFDKENRIKAVRIFYP